MKIKINGDDYIMIIHAIIAACIFSTIPSAVEFFDKIIRSLYAAYVCYLFGRLVELREQAVAESEEDEDLA